MKWIGPALGGVASVIGIVTYATGNMTAPWLPQSKTPEAARTTCVVADPTVDPLNVRTAPDSGRVEDTLEDGVQVWRTNAAPDSREREWAQIALSEGGEPVGWVFADYLDCEPEDQASSP